MRLISVNVGRPRDIVWKGKPLRTGIFKSPVDGPVDVRRHNLAGDEQADASVHGGPSKAVYLYPAHHYPYWRGVLPKFDSSWGAFGENLTVEGVDERTVCVGDEFRVGSTTLTVTEPRMPCLKLAARFGRADMVKLFLESERTGFYLAVTEEGVVQAGDTVELVNRDPSGLTIHEVTRLYAAERDNVALLEKALAVSALPEGWRKHFAEALERVSA